MKNTIPKRVLILGGGFAGVETVARINDFVRRALHSHPHLSEDMARVVVIHSGPVLLPELDESLGRYAQKILAGRRWRFASKERSRAFPAERSD